jgi:hypothetical protein
MAAAQDRMGQDRHSVTERAFAWRDGKIRGPESPRYILPEGPRYVLIGLLAIGALAHAQGTSPPVVGSASVAATSRQNDIPAVGALSARNANYDIDVRLDHAARTLTGTELIRWRNIGRAPADSLRLHLYWNAWANNQSSWMRESALADRPSDVKPEDWSYIRLSSLTLANADGSAGLDLMSGFAYVQPDDGNVEDRTLASVALPAPVAPGSEIAVRVQWQSRVPRTFARTGAVGNYYFIAQWFPKIAVFEDRGWTAHQFHANSEFYSDYGRYDVRITVPQSWVVGATGRAQQDHRDNGDGTETHHFVQEDVHDFAWTTSPDYVEHRQTFRHQGLPPVEMRLLMQPEHRGQEDRHFAATAAALRYYGEWYGAYPYDHITIVDPAHQSGAGGMEYPTLFTAGTRFLAPRQSNTPEAVTIHEAGHQFWYGMVGNNEFEHAWMDEGFNQFSEARVLEAAFRPDYHVQRFFGGFLPWQFHDIVLRRETDGHYLPLYRTAAESDPMSNATFLYHPVTHWWISYAKTALWLHTLERYLGWDTLQRIMKTYFERWKFRHPRPDDFFAIVNEVSGRDMTWFFDQVYRSSNVFDYGVDTLDSARVRTQGYDVTPAQPVYRDATSESSYRTTVVVRRFGEAIFPVDVLVTFENGDNTREKWDGVDRWKVFTYNRPVRAQSVQVDPDRVLLLDVNYTNNSRTLAPQAEAAAQKWSLKWMVWLQDLMLTWGFLV